MAALKSARLWMGSLLVCTWAASAQAQNLCEKSEDCPTGYNCETFQGTTPPCAATPCKMGEACEPPPDCVQQPIEYKQCAPASCETDADCGAQAVCFSQTRAECSGGAAVDVACAPNEMCPKPEPAPEQTCSEYTVKQCLARYVLPCEQDLDCGEGFSCQAGEECTCSGSAGSGSSDKPAAANDAGTAYFAPVPPAEDAGVAKGDAAVSGASPTCECHPTELKHCELKQVSCSVDADCPSDFVCVASASDAIACAAPREGGDASFVACDPKPAEKRCEPRFYAGQGPTRAGVDDGDSAPNYGEGGHGSSTSAPKDSDNSDAGIAPEPPSIPAAASPSCSVSAARAGSWQPLAFGLALIALGMRLRRKKR